jgi:hypothetical protein
MWLERDGNLSDSYFEMRLPDGQCSPSMGSNIPAAQNKLVSENGDTA